MLAFSSAYPGWFFDLIECAVPVSLTYMKGLTLRRIPKGKPGAGIAVAKLHYLADPTMTPRRVALLKSAYPDVTMWDREMEIDPHARGGQKWFPEFDENIHYIDPPEEEWVVQNWTTWLACDPHPRRAHAFLWLMVISTAIWWCRGRCGQKRPIRSVPRPGSQGSTLATM